MEVWKTSEHCHFCRSKIETVLMIPEEPADVVRALNATEKAETRRVDK